MTHTINVYGAKGGVGTSTVAALLAAIAYKDGRNVLLVTDGSKDAASALGVHEPGEDFVTVNPRLHVSQYVRRVDGIVSVTKADIVIIDWGTEIPYLGATAPNETNVMVTTTDYLSIKRGTRKVGPDHRVVVVEKEYSSLTPTDAINAIQGAVFGVNPHVSTTLKASGNVGIARQVDAGLILSRIPHTAEVLHELLP